MRVQDQALLAVTMWRENRAGGVSGMQSVGNVIMNRVSKRGTDAYSECVRHLQVSSITAKGDPELTLWANNDDPQWQTALALAAQAAVNALEDITDGADLYYAPKAIVTKVKIKLPNGIVVPFPQDWDQSAVIYTGTIQGQIFFRSRTA